MASVLFTNARIVDGTAAERGDPVSRPGRGRHDPRGLASIVAPARPDVIDLKGRTLMPGLIDAHVHVVAGVADLGTQRGAAGFARDGARAA